MLEPVTIKADVEAVSLVELRTPMRRLGAIVGRCNTCRTEHDLTSQLWAIVEPCGTDCPRRPKGVNNER
jgi:hypothetical protein